VTFTKHLHRDDINT